MAPVELVGLARRIVERNVGVSCHGPALLRPSPGVAPDSIVTALVTQITQTLEYPDQRQPFARGPGFIGKKQPVELVAPGTKLRLKLTVPFVFELRLVGTQNLANHLARYAQLTADRLDRLALHMCKAAYL